MQRILDAIMESEQGAPLAGIGTIPVPESYRGVVVRAVVNDGRSAADGMR